MENFGEHNWQGKSNKQVSDSIKTVVVCVNVIVVIVLLGIVFYLLS